LGGVAGGEGAGAFRSDQIRAQYREAEMGAGATVNEATSGAEWELLLLRALAMTDETASEFSGTLVVHRRGSSEPVEHVRVRVKRSVLEEMSGTLQRLLARSTRYTR
jgi:hypothetical protein